MQLILDNLIAIIVSVTLAVMLLSLQTSTRQDALERQSVYAAKVQSLTLAEWLERDIVKLGARFGEERDRFSMDTTNVNGTRYTQRFQFAYNEREQSNFVDRVEVRYTLTPTTPLEVVAATSTTPARTVPLFQITRAERAGQYRMAHREGSATVPATWIDASGNPTTAEPGWAGTPGYGTPTGLSYFYIEPRSSDGEPILEHDRARDADYVHLQFSVIPTLFPIERARFIRETGLSYASTFEIRPF